MLRICYSEFDLKGAVVSVETPASRPAEEETQDTWWLWCDIDGRKL